MDAIRHISTPFGGSIIALGEFESRIQIFDIENLSIISEFDSILDFGGNRLAISEDGQVCMIGSWKRNGLCAYNAKTGEIIWQNKELKKVQNIQMLRSDPSKAFIQLEGKVSRILDSKSGEEIETVRAALNYYDCPENQTVVLDSPSGIQVFNKNSTKPKKKIERQSFATLSIAISPSCFSISESAGPLSCYDNSTGELLWRIPVGAETHFLELAHNESLGYFIGVLWPYKHGGTKKLVYLNERTGDKENEIDLGTPTVTKFARHAQQLVTSDREIIKIENGEKKNWA